MNLGFVMADSPLKTAQEAYRIKLQLLAKEAGGVGKFAAMIGKSPAQVSQWINGSKDSKTGKPRSIRPESLRLIEDALGKPAGWLDAVNIRPLRADEDESIDNMTLLSPEENMAAPDTDIPGAMRVVVFDDDTPGIVRIPLGTLKLQAGVNGVVIEPDRRDGGTLGISMNWVRRKGFDPEQLIAMPVTGDSMAPTICEGDTVIINKADKRLVDNAVYAINYEGEAVVKRMARDAGQWWLMSDNPDQRRYFRRACHGKDCMIIGRVVKREGEQF
jgi:hypothetical protein